MDNYNDNEQSRKFSLWITRRGYSNRVKEAERELTEKRRKRKQEEERKRKRQQAKTHPVEVELTKRHSKKLLYIALKPTKKDLVVQR